MRGFSCCCVLAMAAMASASPAARAVYQPISADGFECREWFLDADGDGFGAPGSGLASCAAIAGRVPRADDCDDGNPAIHPLAIDRPDPAYVDANCDGADGDADRAIHVATTGADGAACGSRAAPCATVPFAMGQRTPVRPDIYVRQGVYPGAVIVPALAGAASAGIYGGFDTNWQRAPGVIVRIEGQPLATLDGGSGGVHVESATVEIGDLEIEAPDAVGQSLGLGRASVGLVARNATLTVWGARIRAGRGSVGVSGGPGSPIAGTAPSGANGGNAISRPTCSTVLGGIGGVAVAGACPSGISTTSGAGGRGGPSDTACGTFPNPAAQEGENGLNAVVTAGPSGTGGAGGAGTIVCSTPGIGRDGVPGTAGAGGAPGSGGSVVAGNWRSNSGGAGFAGSNGGGGGGGGGSGGCDAGGNAAGAGGGSGGAGGCGATTGGSGGGGGGASIAVLLTATTATITGSELRTAGGGNGGAGGSGAPGQPGGPGGPGGLSVQGTAPGAPGGAGGHGGPSGGGGGGAGGPSYGVLRVGGSLPPSTPAVNSFVLGPGGLGGAAGPPATGGNPGATGSNGAVVQVQSL